MPDPLIIFGLVAVVAFAARAAAEASRARIAAFYRDQGHHLVPASGAALEVLPPAPPSIALASDMASRRDPP